MRLRAKVDDDSNNDLRLLAEWILAIGDGKCRTSIEGIDNIQIPDDNLIENSDDLILEIYKATYPELFSFMMSLNPEKAKIYYSSDMTCQNEANNDMLASIHTPEFLDTIRCSGIPNQKLTFKVGTPIMLLRNIDHSAGLCNGTRLVVTKLENHIIEARSLTENDTE
ncbi:uncharacterized protein [Arachis hypogaea]|uniref:uncharacterized protein n=1 Tax=Arachis hypogaea TaxID=3818 RepID=UPI003B222689